MKENDWRTIEPDLPKLLIQLPLAIVALGTAIAAENKTKGNARDIQTRRGC
jgi:hypothetical protein